MTTPDVMPVALLPSTIAAAIGWTVVHSIWQVTLIAGFCRVGLFLLRDEPPAHRYALACASLFATPAIAAATLLGLLESPGLARVPLVPFGAVDGPVLEWILSAAAAAHRVAPAVAAGWVAGVTILGLRMVGGLSYLAWTCRRRCEPVTGPCLEAADTAIRRLAMSAPVRILHSAAVDVPLTLGWLRPVVIVPTALLACTPAGQLEAIVAHELAHVRRHDYLVNVLQAIVRILFFHHPAVWWLSRQIDAEREYCCDDLAAAACGDRRLYARALLALEERRTGLVPAPRADGGSLIDRIRRLVARRDAQLAQTAPSRVGATVIGAALAISWLVVATTVVQPVAQRSMEPPSVVDVLAEALRHADPEVRREAAEALDALEDVRAVEPLVATLRADVVDVVRREAAEALGEIGDTRAVAALVEALADQSPDVRRETADALGSLKDRRAVPALLDVARDVAPDVRREAARALGELGDRRALGELRRLAADPHADVRSAAVRALARLVA